MIREIDSEVTPLSPRQSIEGGAVLDDLERYWRSLRGASRLPVRHEIDPARIDAALPHSFVLERVAPGVARMRVAGQKLSALFGMEARGMPISSLFAAGDRVPLATMLELAFKTPALVEFAVRSPRRVGRPLLAGRMLLLPLLDNDGQVTRALGAVVLDGANGKTPRHLEIPVEVAPRIEPLDTPQPTQTAGIQGRHLRLVVDNG